MNFVTLLGNGFRAARRHPRLILAAYLVPLVPALLLAALARSSFAPVLDFSLFSERVLDGRWFAVWRDFSPSPASDLGVVLGSGLTLAMLVAALLQVPVAAGTVEVLLARDGVEHPFFAGVAAHSGRFFRAVLWFLPAAALAAGLACGTAALFFKLAEKQSNARLDLVGLGAAALVALLLLAILDPAYDLARIAAARHGDRKTLRGYLRAIGVVLRRPAVFLPLFASLVLLAVALHLVYTAARSPWTPATALAILAVLLAQQLVMGLRALLQVTSWGAEVAAYRALGEPRLCEQRAKRPRPALIVVDEPPAAPVPAPEPEAATPPLEAADVGLAAPEPTPAPSSAEPELPPEPAPAPSPREPEPDPFRVEDDVFAAEEKR